MIERYRDLQEIFNLKNLPTEDVERLIYWAKGIRAGYKGHALVEIPVVFINDFVDGSKFGNELYHLGCKLV